MNNPEDLRDFQREATPGKGLTVTRILRRAGLVRFYIPAEQLRRLAEEGHQVHYAAADAARGEEDYWSEIEWLSPYIRAFRQFQKDFGFHAELIEHKVSHPAGYTGTLDMAGTIFTGSKKRQKPVVIEIKRAVPAKPYALQTAAYMNGLGREFKAFKRAERRCVYLRANGSYSAPAHENPNDFTHFISAMNVARLRQEWGLVDDEDERHFDQILRAGPVEDPEEFRI